MRVSVVAPMIVMATLGGGSDGDLAVANTDGNVSVLKSSAIADTSCSTFNGSFCDDFSQGMRPEWIQTGDCTWEIVDGVLHTSLAGPEPECRLTVFNSSWQDYTFQFDVRGNAGVDKIVAFRVQDDALNRYEVNIRSDWLTGDEVTLHKAPGSIPLQVVQYPTQNGTWYHVEITCIGGQIDVRIDGNLVISYSDPAPLGGGGISVIAYKGGAGASDIDFDNVGVSQHPCPTFRGSFCDDFTQGMKPEWTQTGDCIWETADGVLHASLLGYQRICHLTVPDGSWQDYTFEFDVKGNAGVDKLVFFRVQDPWATYYQVNIRSDWVGKDEVGLFRLQGGTGVLLEEVQYPTQNGTWYHVEITCIGSQIDVRIDGNLVISYSDPTPLVGGGISVCCFTGMAGACDIDFDNVGVCPCVCHGDPFCDGIRCSRQDVVKVVDEAFRAAPPVFDLHCGRPRTDVNCNGNPEVQDVVKIVNVAFRGANPATEFCGRCQ